MRSKISNTVDKNTESAANKELTLQLQQTKNKVATQEALMLEMVKELDTKE